jgi:phosphoribosyl 1,2-cyclic phosphodiesterase
LPDRLGRGVKFASVGSGSEGNALLISATSGTTTTHVMLDCGFGPRELSRRFNRLDMSPDQLAGIVVTHEHSDHLGGVFQVARQYKVPVWLTHGSFESASKHEAVGVDVHICRDGEPFDVGDLEIRPYTVPHDAREPVQYTASDGRFKLGVLTDVGHATQHLISALQFFIRPRVDQAVAVPVDAHNAGPGDGSKPQLANESPGSRRISANGQRLQVGVLQ